jgi:hypothetical protein
VGGRAGEDHPHREDRARPGRALGRRGRGRRLTPTAARALCVAATLALAACARRAPEPPPPTLQDAPPKIVEQRLQPTTTPELVVGPIRETPGAGGQQTFVTGTIRNRGSRPTRDVVVHVSGRDAAGATVVTVDALPVPQLIPPGGQAEYTVSLPNDPAIRTFHVEAIGR